MLVRKSYLVCNGTPDGRCLGHDGIDAASQEAGPGGSALGGRGAVEPRLLAYFHPGSWSTFIPDSTTHIGREHPVIETRGPIHRARDRDRSQCYFAVKENMAGLVLYKTLFVLPRAK
jgi:hypothetical protein